jgi:hypothetical protein
MLARCLGAASNVIRGGDAMLPATAHRVALNTGDESNQRIRRQTELNVYRYASAGPAAIEARLQELDHEWDVERFLETMAPTLSLAGLLLGCTRSRAWLLLPAVVQTFFLQHALQGWCPPIPVLRRLGIRTTEEINHERTALKALRGDFRTNQGGQASPESAVHAARK